MLTLFFFYYSRHFRWDFLFHKRFHHLFFLWFRRLFLFQEFFFLVRHSVVELVNYFLFIDYFIKVDYLLEVNQEIFNFLFLSILCYKSLVYNACLLIWLKFEWISGYLKTLLFDWDYFIVWFLFQFIMISFVAVLTLLFHLF